VAFKKNRVAVEAAIKYLIPGGFAAGVLTFGISFVYGATGTLAFSGVATLGSTISGLPIFTLGMLLVLAAVGFKVSLVPFHAWTPDVYKGSGTTVTAFMSVTVKSAVFFVFIRILAQTKTFQMIHLDQVIALLAVVSIVFGNIVALKQTSFKGLMAYSSIAHAGYMALGLVTNSAASRNALTFYVAIYAIMNLMAFAAFLFLKDRKEGAVTLSDLTGLGREFPFWGLVFSLSLFSLAAIPPFPGFLAKYLVFSEAIKAGYYVTTVVALLGSAVSVYYYLRVVYLIYAEPVDEKNKLSTLFPIGEKSLLIGSVLLTMLFFLLTFAPNFLLEIIGKASEGL
jgi:NADH-quinone oxidoreductase subunit N